MPETTVAHSLRRPPAGRKTAPRRPAAPATDCPTAVDTHFLESLTGYNARRGALAVIGLFLERMAPYGLRPVDFSVLTLIAHNPGITSRQICAALDILPPNLVGMLKSLQKRALIERREHPGDRRAQGLHLSQAGATLQAAAQTTAQQLEEDATSSLSAAERDTLNALLRKLYQSRSGAAGLAGDAG